MKKLIRLSGCLLLVLFAGCVVIPIPLPETPVAGKQIRREQVTFITPGSTHREDVIRELGEPYAEFPDLRILAYKGEVHAGVVIWGAGGPGGGGAGKIDVYKYYGLLIAFDPGDRVVTFEQTRILWPWDTLREHALKWAEAQDLAVPKAPSTFVAGEIAPGQSALYLYREGGFWDNSGLPNLKPEARVDGKVVGWLPKGQYLAIALAPGAHTVTINYLHNQVITSLDRAALGRTVTAIDMQTLPGQAHYVAVQPRQGTPVLTVRSEEEALPALREMTAMSDMTPPKTTLDLERYKTLKLVMTDEVKTLYSTEGLPLFEAFLKGKLQYLGYSVGNGEADVTVQVRILSFSPGNRTARLLVGFGAGRAELKYVASFRDQSGALITQLEEGTSYNGMELVNNPLFKTDEDIRMEMVREAALQVGRFIRNNGELR